MPNSSRWAECGGCTGPRRQLHLELGDPADVHLQTPKKLNMEPDTWGPTRSLDLAQLGSRTSLVISVCFWVPNEATNFLQRRLLLELS